MKEWKEITGYEGLYEVSNDGQVKNVKSGRLLKQSIRPKGYVAVTLYKGNSASRKSFLVHRLVASSFLGQSDLQVNHKDLNKQHNHVDNLEYCTNLENMQHANVNGVFNEDRNNRKKPLLQIHPITGEVVKEWDCGQSARQAGYHASTNVANGKAQSSKGYYFKFKEDI